MSIVQNGSKMDKTTTGLLLQEQPGQLEGFIKVEDPVMDIINFSPFPGGQEETEWVADFQQKFTKLLEDQKQELTSTFEEKTKQLNATIRSLRQEVERQKRTILSLGQQLSEAARKASEKAQTVAISMPPMPKIPASLLAAASSLPITKSVTTTLPKVDLRPTTALMIKTGISNNSNGPSIVVKPATKINNNSSAAATTTPAKVVVTPVVSTPVISSVVSAPIVSKNDSQNVSTSENTDKVPSFYLCPEDEINGEKEDPSDQEEINEIEADEDEEVEVVALEEEDEEKEEIVIFDDEDEEIGEEEEEEEDFDYSDEEEMEYYYEGSEEEDEELEEMEEEEGGEEEKNPLTPQDIKVESSENQDCPIIVSVTSGNGSNSVKRSRKSAPGLRPGVDLGDVIYGVQPDPPPDPLAPKIRRRVRRFGGTRPYNCEICDKTFTDHWPLHIHRRIHTGERPHKCSWPKCTKTFTQLSHLQQHERIHKQERPYECPECGDKFVQKCHLNQHRLIHSGVKPYQCDFCVMAFRQKAGLHGHIRRRHADKRKIKKKK